MKNGIGIIIQARTGSSRLPQKMTIPFDEEKGILETILIRLKQSDFRLPIIVATTTNVLDNVIERLALRNKLLIFRGSEDNVLDRFINTAEHFGFRKIIRICADNPFLDLEALAWQINSFIESPVDYWCYSLSDKTPTIKTHYGFWAEGVTISALKKIAVTTNKKLFQEHVTNYIYTHPESFKIHYEEIDRSIEKEKNIRLTIDTKEDFLLAKKVFIELKQRNIPFKAEKIISYIKGIPEYMELMKNEISANIK